MATRRKLQKLFALVMVLSMTVGMLNIPVFAEDGDPLDTYDLKAGASRKITNYTKQEGSWTSSDENVAVVTEEEGVVTVTGIDAGTATITHSFQADGQEGGEPSGEPGTGDPGMQAETWIIRVTREELVFGYENASAAQSDPSQLVGDTLMVSTDPNVAFKLWTIKKTTGPDGAVTYTNFSNTKFTPLTVQGAENTTVVAAENNSTITISGSNVEGTDTLLFSGTSGGTTVCGTLEVTASDQLVSGLYIYGQYSSIQEPVDGVLSLSKNGFTNLKCGLADSRGNRIPGASIEGQFTLISGEDVLRLNSNNSINGLSTGIAEIKAEAEGYPPKTLTVQVGTPVYTVALNLYADDGAGIDAAGVLAALEAAGVTDGELKTDASGSYVALPGKVVTFGDLEGYLTDFSRENTAKSAEDYAATVNELFFGGESLLTVGGLSDFYFSSVYPTIGTFTAKLNQLPGASDPEPDPDTKVTLTLINLDDTVVPVAEEGKTVYYIDQDDIVEHEYPLNWVVNVNQEHTSADLDNPVTAWVRATVQDTGDGRMIVEPESTSITGTIRMEGDVTLYAFHNTEDHYIRVVVLEDNQATNLIEQGQNGNKDYDETPDEPPYNTHYYLPKSFNGTVDSTYPVSLTEYQALYDGAYADSAAERAALVDFMEGYDEYDEVTAAINNGSKIFYSTDATRYKWTTAGVEIVLADGSTIYEGDKLTIVTFIVSLTNPPSGGSSYDYYKVTVNYLDAEGNDIAPSFTSSSIREGRSWDYSDKQLETITVGDVTYTFDRAEGDPITGTNIQRNQVVDLYYAPESELEEPDVPQGELPDEEPDEPTDLPDEDVPQGELPDEDVPKADAPETGDVSALWLALSVLSGTGLAAVILTGRKKREDGR